VPLFYYLGVPLAEATPTTLLLNVVSLMFAAFNYWAANSSTGGSVCPC
jgi:uncharacterized membrane protein YfcA